MGLFSRLSLGFLSSLTIPTRLLTAFPGPVVVVAGTTVVGWSRSGTVGKDELSLERRDV